MQQSPLEEPKGTVLLVDDNAQILRAHERILGRAGYTVDTALDGLQAIAKVEAGGIDAIVSAMAACELGSTLTAV